MRENKKSGKKAEEHHFGQPVYMMSQSDTADEIDLFDLIDAVWKKRFFLATWTTVITAAAVAVALMLPRFYTAEATFYPPKDSDVKPLCITGVYSISQDDAYRNLISFLQMKDTRREVFDEYFHDFKDDASKRAAFLRFCNAVKLEKSKPDKKTLVKTTPTLLSYSSKIPENAATVVNALIEKGKDASKKYIIADRSVKLNFKIEQLVLKLELLKTRTKAELEDSIATYEEAITIAEKLGIQYPLEFKIQKLSKVSLSAKSNMNADIQGKATELYMRGTNALRAELDALCRRRDNIDPFVPGLRKLQAQIEELKKIEERPVAFAPLSLLVKAGIPSISSKPNRKLIVLSGLMLALITGFGIVLLRYFMGLHNGELSNS